MTKERKYYKIQKDIPIPKKKGQSAPHITASQSLEVGDSFVVENRKIPSIRISMKANGKKISARAESSMWSRVWRIK